jgi:hypothetical protein
MHNSCPNVDWKALLVAVNRCRMRIYFCPNMPVVAVENPLPAEAGLICIQNNCGKVRLLCTLAYKPMCKLVSMKVTVGAHSLHLLPMERMERCSRTTFHTR